MLLEGLFCALAAVGNSAPASEHANSSARMPLQRARVMRYDMLRLQRLRSGSWITISRPVLFEGGADLERRQAQCVCCADDIFILGFASLSAVGEPDLLEPNRLAAPLPNGFLARQRRPDDGPVPGTDRGGSAEQRGEHGVQRGLGCQRLQAEAGAPLLHREVRDH